MAVRGAGWKQYLSSSAFSTPGHKGLTYLYGSLYPAGIYGRGGMNRIGGEITRWKGWCCESRRPESRDQPEMGRQGPPVTKVEG